MGDAVALKGLWVCACLLLVVGCRFHPDYSRFAECSPEGACAEGSQCWTTEWRCVPLCGEEPECDGGLIVEDEDGGDDAGFDGGEVDGGDDGGEVDAGPLPLMLDAGAPLRAVELEPYVWRLEAFGGTSPYTFGRVDGGLPGGIIFSGDGELTGTPSEHGPFPIEVRVVDQSSPVQTSSGLVDFSVSPLLRIGTKTQLADAISNGAYNEQLYATGGTPPYFWTVDAGTALPSGLQLSSSGAIAGNVGGAASYSFIGVVTDSDVPPQEKRRTFTLTVRGNPLGPEFLTNHLADGRTGYPYSQLLRASGGSPPLSFAQTGGELPPGVTFAGATISGTPTDAGTYSVTYKVDDSLLGSQSATFSITIH